MPQFLEQFDARRWSALAPATPGHIRAAEFYVGTDPSKGRDISVRVVDADRRPARDDLERLWQSVAQTQALVVVARYTKDGSAVADLVGGRRKVESDGGKPARPRPLIIQGVPVAEARNFCTAVLTEGSPHAANRLVARWMDERATELPGLKNDGLFARHALLEYVPDRADWPQAGRSGTACRQYSGRDLVTALGFTIDDVADPGASLLIARGAPQAAALFLEGAGSFDDVTAEYGARSPVTHALAIARRHRVRWVVLTRGRSIRLHPVSPDMGVGRRGRSTTYIEINLHMLPEENCGYLWLLFSATALEDGGTIDEILSASDRFAHSLGTRLRERIYTEVVPSLSTVLGRRLGPTTDTDVQWLAEAYRQCMIVLFRLLFVAYAEDRGLLPFGRNASYTKSSLKNLAQSLAPYVEGEAEYSDTSAVLWRRVVDLWRAVDRGKRDWGIPEYNGGLFSATTRTGAALNQLELTDAEFGPALARLVVDVDEDGVVGAVDFRSLSVREFGTIYEGLLESELSRAETDLAVDSKGFYIPASQADAVVVSAGDVYFHNKSGARKSTGSYFTKPFAVEHLLDHALEPAIEEHLDRVRAQLDTGDDASATSHFFDFRCVDLAMGSGHFLVAAVDRLEARLSEFIVLHPTPGISAELETLRASALNQLHQCADDALIEDSALLRRQIARRCVYGVDLNPISVELARVAMWIHTFVPGLPLSFLDHNLVLGNSLTGVGTLDEADSLLGDQLGSQDVRERIATARPALERMSTVIEATVADVNAARSAHEEAREAIEPTRKLFDLLILDRARLANVHLLNPTPEVVAQLHASAAVCHALDELAPMHFPVAFPEVFLRERPGFDCILGNPPWEKVKVEEHGFWGLRLPGLRSLPAGQRRTEVLRVQATRPDLVSEYRLAIDRVSALKSLLFHGPFPGISAGDPDLYIAFAWRFWTLSRAGGTIGVVLPRSAVSGTGMSEWRDCVLDAGSFTDVTMTTNTAGWVFDDAEPRYTIGFVSIRKSLVGGASVTMRGPFRSLADYQLGMAGSGLTFPSDDFRTWSTGAAFPLLPDQRSGGLFLRLRAHPRLDANVGDWHARPVRELHATDDRGLFTSPSERRDGSWPVWKGESFELWNPDTGVVLGWADPEQVTAHLYAKRLRQQRLGRSGFSEFTEAWALAGC